MYLLPRDQGSLVSTHMTDACTLQVGHMHWLLMLVNPKYLCIKHFWKCYKWVYKITIINMFWKPINLRKIIKLQTLASPPTQRRRKYCCWQSVVGVCAVSQTQTTKTPTTRQQITNNSTTCGPHKGTHGCVPMETIPLLI